MNLSSALTCVSDDWAVCERGHEAESTAERPSGVTGPLATSAVSENAKLGLCLLGQLDPVAYVASPFRDVDSCSLWFSKTQSASGYTKHESILISQ